MVRRLPVLQNKASDEGPARPPMQWVFIGAGLVVSFWVPLLTIAMWLRARLVQGGAANAEEFAGHMQGAAPLERLGWLLSAVLPVLVPWLLACLFAGMLVGRFGGAARGRHAMYAGLLAAGLACGVAALSGAFDSVIGLFASALVLGTTGAGMSWLGGKFGERRRSPG
jgi:hypothetical protein